MPDISRRCQYLKYRINRRAEIRAESSNPTATATFFDIADLVGEELLLLCFFFSYAGY